MRWLNPLVKKLFRPVFCRTVRFMGIVVATLVVGLLAIDLLSLWRQSSR